MNDILCIFTRRGAPCCTVERCSAPFYIRRLALLALACCGTVWGSPVFQTKPVDPVLREVYAEIRGNSFSEKNRNALTTVEMNAVSAMQHYIAEQQMNDAAEKLFQSLDAEGQNLLVQTHQAWREYIELQARFVTDPCRGGSARGIYAASVIQTEFKKRTKLYQEMLAGKTCCTTGLSAYN